MMTQARGVARKIIQKPRQCCSSMSRCYYSSKLLNQASCMAIDGARGDQCRQCD